MDQVCPIMSLKCWWGEGIWGSWWFTLTCLLQRTAFAPRNESLLQRWASVTHPHGMQTTRRTANIGGINGPSRGCLVKYTFLMDVQHKWKYFNAVSEKAVSHEDFMSILSNVEYIIIKASYGTGLQQSRSEITWNYYYYFFFYLSVQTSL